MSVRAVVVAHRETLAAEGIATALTGFPALAVVGVATSASEAERHAERADAVAIDVRLAGSGGAIARLRKRGVRVVVIGGPMGGDDDAGVVVAVDASVARLADALAPGVRPRLPWGRGLSPREGQVLRLAAKGMAAKQIARVLGISAKTVEQHKTRAFKRLDVPNQAAAVALLTDREEQGMEPIHYLRAIRRRWWVIALSVVVAGTAAFITTTETVSSGLGTPAVPAGTEYTATTILWDPGAPLVGQGTPITSLDTLAQLVRLADVTAIAAKKLGSDEDPIELSTKVSAIADPATGFLSVTGRANDPKRAEAISTAFSQGLIEYLGELHITQIDQRQRLVEEQIKALQEQSGDATVIASLQAALAQLEIDRTTPISLTAIQRASAQRVAAETGGFQAPKSRISRVLLASLFGLLAGVALALVLERYDTRIRSTPSAEDAFGLPVLAEIPSIRRGRRDGVVTESHPLSRAAGAFRLLQVGVQRWTSDTDAATASTILVTSPEARDGKTTIAANLATAFAQAGNRVLVVSVDLRRPAIHSAFDVSLEPGLTDAVRAMNGSGSAATLDLGPYLEPCAVVRLAVLPSGMIPDHPAELLGSEKMRELIERLKKLSDVLILDAAPLVVASDVVPLVPEADGVLLVARAGKTRREIASSAATLIDRMGAKRVGVVMNDAREFSIPLAKRGMYQPTRKMRKAAERRRRPTTDEPRSTQPAHREESSREPQVDEPTWVDEPTTVDEPTAVEAPIVVEESADASRGQMLSSMSKAQQELRDLRTRLEGFKVDLPAEGVAGVE